MRTVKLHHVELNQAYRQVYSLSLCRMDMSLYRQNVCLNFSETDEKPNEKCLSIKFEFLKQHNWLLSVRGQPTSGNKY